MPKVKNLAKYERTKHAETHKCVWCEMRLDACECDFEVEFDGWLCQDCQAALRSRGERLILVKE